jgi:hypothetical protein
MDTPWRPWIATSPILQTWSGSGWPEPVSRLADEAWAAVADLAAHSGGESPGSRLQVRLGDLHTDLGADRGLADGPLGEAVRAEVRAGVRFGAMLGFALARTYPGSSDELDAWLEQALDYVGESMGGRIAPQDGPSPA